MRRSSERFGRIYLPYCLQQVDGHGHVVLNRLYKPLGIQGLDFVDYAPHAQTLVGLTPAVATQLSWDGVLPDLGKIWLYRDAVLPTANAANWDTYQRRLAVLASLRIG